MGPTRALRAFEEAAKRGRGPSLCELRGTALLLDGFNASKCYPGCGSDLHATHKRLRPCNAGPHTCVPRRPFPDGADGDVLGATIPICASRAACASAVACPTALNHLQCIRRDFKASRGIGQPKNRLHYLNAHHASRP